MRSQPCGHLMAILVLVACLAVGKVSGGGRPILLELSEGLAPGAWAPDKCYLCPVHGGCAWDLQ